MFAFLLTPVLVQAYTSYRQARAYEGMIDSIAYANQLKTDVNSEIEPVVWRIVAGKETFGDSGVMPLIADIRLRMNGIYASTLTVETRGIMEVSLRALNTLENYLDKLKTQIDNRGPVAENEKIYEEIILCVGGIDDLLQKFSSRQLAEVAALNQEASKRSNQNFVISISLMLVVVVVGAFVFLYISRVLRAPIKKLLSQSNRISEGDFGSRIELSASEEFNELAQGMNIMSEKIALLIAKNVEEEKQLQMLEYKAHQAQISPHFLYNTLDAIIWAAEAKDMPRIIMLVSSLSSFFRISLSHGIDFIPIEDEVTHVQNYLAIQQVRYSDVLSYEINVDEGLGGQKILKLLLQPLVENSLYHGIRGTRERGKITVSIRRQGGKVRFCVADNGAGMTGERLAALRREIGTDSGNPKGYGLFSVNQRLKLYYGLSEGVSIRSEHRKGTEVSFELDIL